MAPQSIALGSQSLGEFDGWNGIRGVVRHRCATRHRAPKPNLQLEISMSDFGGHPAQRGHECLPAWHHSHKPAKFATTRHSCWIPGRLSQTAQQVARANVRIGHASCDRMLDGVPSRTEQSFPARVAPAPAVAHHLTLGKVCEREPLLMITRRKADLVWRIRDVTAVDRLGQPIAWRV